MFKFSLFTPLEQFEILLFKTITIPFLNLDISLTNATISLFFVVISLVLFFLFSLFNMKVIPTRFQSVCELLYKFVFDMLKQQSGLKGEHYFPLFFLTFIFILFSNLLGMMPFGFTITSHIIVTFSLALSFNLSLFFLGLHLHGVKFFKLFVPSNAPVPLIPLLVVIEVTSYLIRTFSLSLRLFANMMAGHTLLFILSSFVLAFLKTQFAVLAVFPFIIVLAIVVLEFCIAFLQAYVFVILLCIYLNDSLHPSH